MQPSTKWDSMLSSPTDSPDLPAPPYSSAQPRSALRSLDDVEKLWNRSRARSVSFCSSQDSSDTEYVEGTGAVEIVAEDTTAYEIRTLGLDTIYGLLEQICRSNGKWVKYVSKNCPIERHNIATP